MLLLKELQHNEIFQYCGPGQRTSLIWHLCHLKQLRDAEVAKPQLKANYT